MNTFWTAKLLEINCPELFLLLLQYLLGLTVRLTAVVHESRAVTLQCCVNDLQRRSTATGRLPFHSFKWSFKICYSLAHLIIL